MSSDPILDEIIDRATGSGMFEEGKAEYDEAYGLGKWPKATLLEVVTYEPNAYGYKLGLKLALKGGEEMPFTGRFDLPMTPESNGDTPDYVLKRVNDKRAVLNRGLAAVGYSLVTNKNVDDDAAYQAVADLFRAKVGEACPVHVKADGKNVKGDDGKWTFEPNGFTKIDFLRRGKK